MSGAYRCVASNSAGTDQLDIHFYVTGDPKKHESSPQLMAVFVPV